MPRRLVSPKRDEGGSHAKAGSEWRTFVLTPIRGRVVRLAVPAKAVQLGLDFALKPPELFAGEEMGEDALRVLKDIIDLQASIRTDVAAEFPHLRDAAKWASRLPRTTSPSPKSPANAD